jgi:hypothetical protein
MPFIAGERGCECSMPQAVQTDDASELCSHCLQDAISEEPPAGENSPMMSRSGPRKGW